jgi:UDP-N-acetylglucosamine diphosphorylase/glucosamine-1-phosphate N-acetyltransferase
MASTICIFEDELYSHFLPLVYFRPVYNLRCGILSFKEKLYLTYPRARFVLHTRPYLADYMRLRNPGVQVNELPTDACLFVNGRVIVDDDLAKKIPLKPKRDQLYVNGNQVVAAHVSGKKLDHIHRHLHTALSEGDFDGLPKTEVDVEMVGYPWDVIHKNPEQLIRDFSALTKTQRRRHSSKGAVLINPRQIHIGEGTSLKPGVVLDAEEGPIYIGRNVKFFPYATVMGPAYVGDGSWVKTGAQIMPGTSIGPVCKVGGEVEGSVIHGFSNKQHHGFLGHSYVGAWVNMGAGTTNSDLKSNYSTIKVNLGGEQIDTGHQFLGLILGDHSKTSINSMFNAGTVIGVSCNIFGDGFSPKHVPSFSWGAAGETFTTFALERAIDVARRVMARRNVRLSELEEKLFHVLFDLTRDERRRRGMPF